MSRFPPIAPKDLDATQLTVEPAMEKIFQSYPELEYKDAEGNFHGPYASIFYTPDLITAWFGIAAAVTSQPRLTKRQKELAILAVLAVYDAPYVLYAHTHIAVQAGLTEAQVQAAAAGRLPEGLAAEEAAAYELCLKLARDRAPLDRESWEAARKALGRDQVAGLAHVVSGFVYVSMLTNIGDGVVPGKGKASEGGESGNGEGEGGKIG